MQIRFNHAVAGMDSGVKCLMTVGKPSLHLILDMACDTRCTICAAAWPYPLRLSTQQAIDRLHQGIELGIEEVVFSGGEVTLRRDLCQLIRKARELGYYEVIVLTNGRRLSDKSLTDALVSSGITGLGSTLHGSTPDVHEQITLTPGSFLQTVRGIETVRSLWPLIPLSINCVISLDNHHLIDQTVGLLMDLGVRVIQLTYVVPVGKAKGIFSLPDMPSMSTTLPFVKQAIELFLSRSSMTPQSSISLAFYPFCVLRGMEVFSSEINQSVTYLATDTGELTPIQHQIDLQELKVKRTDCDRCTFSGICDGIWREYAEFKGWAEFVPITEYTPQDLLG